MADGHRANVNHCVYWRQFSAARRSLRDGCTGRIRTGPGLGGSGLYPDRKILFGGGDRRPRKLIERGPSLGAARARLVRETTDPWIDHRPAGWTESGSPRVRAFDSWSALPTGSIPEQ